MKGKSKSILCFMVGLAMVLTLLPFTSIKANAEDESYTVTYNLGILEGTGLATTPASQTDMAFGDIIIQPTPPTAAGYVFEGWYENAELTDPREWDTDEKYIGNGNITLYAKWSVPATGVSLNYDYATVREGESINLIATVTPDNATDKSVTWSSTSSDDFSVTSDGKVTGNNALQYGYVTAKTSNNLTSFCKIYVASCNADTFTFDNASKTMTITATIPSQVILGIETFDSYDYVAGAHANIQWCSNQYLIKDEDASTYTYYDGISWATADNSTKGVIAFEAGETYGIGYKIYFVDDSSSFNYPGSVKININGREYVSQLVFDGSTQITNGPRYDYYSASVVVNLGTLDVCGNFNGGDFSSVIPSSPSSSVAITSETVAVPAETATVTVIGEGSLNVAAAISEGKALISDISKDSLEGIINDTTTDNLTLDISSVSSYVRNVELSRENFERLAEVVSDETNEVDSITIKMKSAEVIIDDATLASVLSQATGSTIELVVDANLQESQLTEAQKAVLSKMEVAQTFEAYFISNGQRIGSFNGGSAVVSLGFNIPEGKDAKYYHIYYLQDDGTMTHYATRYNNGRIEFTANHFSDYCIIYDETLENETVAATTAVQDVYVVKKGDCFWNIAKKFDMNVWELMALNPDLAAQKYIYAGQQVTIIK